MRDEALREAVFRSVGGQVDTFRPAEHCDGDARQNYQTTTCASEA
jgi:hypothetical protein